MFYVIEVLLPFSIRLPLQETIEFTFNQHRCGFVHLERISMLQGNIKIPASSYIPADKYGLYFRSKVLLVLTRDVVEELLKSESQKLQGLFDLDAYVSNCFGLPGTKIKPFTVGAINYFLSIYRVLSQEWHITPVAPKDLTNVKLSKDESGNVSFLSALHFMHQVVSTGGNETLTEQQMTLLKSGITTGGRMSPMATLEADIHDKATQGEFLSACILIGLLVEESIKDHVIQYISLKESLTIEDAERTLIKPNGYALGVSDLLDKPRKKKKNFFEKLFGRRFSKNRSCFIEELIGWKPYQEKAYANWHKNVRVPRNKVIHSGKKDFQHEDIKIAWESSCEILALSRKKFIEELENSGVTLSESIVIKFYSPLSQDVCPLGLLSDFNVTGHE